MNIQESIIAIMNVSAHTKAVEKFARSKYDEKFPFFKYNKQGFHYYTGYEIYSDTKIRINYSYGSGEIEYDDSFIIDITPEIRDNKIDEIIKI